MTQSLRVIGIMSGTSLDGLDLCYAEFQENLGVYEFEILNARTLEYSAAWIEQLKNAIHLPSKELDLLSMAYAELISQKVNEFIIEENITDEIDLIASHGQTIFHEPHKGITVQIGDGQTLANKTGHLVINDFRILDVELGGQGAPLVPIGDKLLFSQYESCLNLGGIANISFERAGERVAFDVCPANLPLNKIAASSFKCAYDKNGDLAKSGELIPDLLDQLNALEYYKKASPKSFGVEWLNHYFYPIVDNFQKHPSVDVLHTLVVHEAKQIAEILRINGLSSVCITGGGAYNSFFIDQLKMNSTTKIIVPDAKIVEFKEALIFGFLGFLNLNNQINTLKSVTGASKDSIGGKRYYPQIEK